MHIRRTALALVVLLWLLGSTLAPNSAPFAQAQQAPTAQSAIQVVFPSAEGFAALQDRLQQKSQLSGAAWTREFKKHKSIGQLSASNGVKGVLFADATALLALLAGQKTSLIYGTIEIPEGGKLGGQEFAGNYGLVLFTGSLDIALIDLQSGETGAFLVVPGDEQTLIIPILFPLFSPLAIFQILLSALALPAPASPQPAPPQPVPPAPLVPACLQNLPQERDINLPLSQTASILKATDGSGKQLFALAIVPPSSLSVRSFGAAVQFIYASKARRQIGFIIGAGVQQVRLIPDTPFTLFVTDGSKMACLQATPQRIGGLLTLVGKLRTN